MTAMRVLTYLIVMMLIVFIHGVLFTGLRVTSEAQKDKRGVDLVRGLVLWTYLTGAVSAACWMLLRSLAGG